MPGQVTHGMCGTRVYRIWAGMIERCRCPTNGSFQNYGARGIYVCKRWQKFEAFLEDMGHPPPGTSIERIKNDKPYTRANCRWATRKEQQRNTRWNVFLEHDGLRLCVSEWSEKLGISKSLIYGRVRLGWSDSKALTTPTKGVRSGVKNVIST